MAFGIIMIVIGLPALALFVWAGITDIVSGDGDGLGFFYLAAFFGVLPLFMGIRRFVQLRHLKRYQEDIK